jgi:hypothetical protein
MIRDHVLLGAGVVLLFVLAFGILPSAEHYKNKDTDRSGEGVDEYKRRPKTGIKTLPSGSMPRNDLLDQMGEDLEDEEPEPIEDDDGGRYILKSSLVPCSCPDQSMSCERHAGSRPHQRVPGEMDDAPWESDDWRQERYKKPFKDAFPHENEPSGFLNSFSAFMK